MSAYLTGLGLGASMIIPIGAQNTYVLTSGMRRRFPFWVATLCAFCDIVLVFLGVMGVGTLISSNPLLIQAACWGGALFLAWYGWLSLRSAMQPHHMREASMQWTSLKSVLLGALAVTLLNPHVYLDTVVVLGSIGGQYPAGDRLYFALGAMCASILWFYSLGLGAAKLAPWLDRPLVWKLVDGGVWLLMWFLSIKLALKGLEVAGL
ncbi:LysE/ArgO family amino acid transporter [Aestuariirhabdus sp. Z084]|uniref:LysE/ArgO family amino acid transporter n=1 Tax=Aestuariirhabdus haliotis TaxID=2918751 RepID=UPI00201B37E7|nr:LysE/ArgO family amino acid transporter [Aestuariirhabdus haliotis]MCL6417450.1 LysE/ArgO family amino acid transporter [Aestuariirhabdus haliotis]MCL6421398.1 LysE/ArgO family amino acid transporter [Aestuariirhabdus haliotis]